MKKLTQLLFLLVVSNTLCHSQVSTKRIIREGKRPIPYTETFSIIKKGEFKGLRHGDYQHKSYWAVTKGQYTYGKRTGKWEVRRRRSYFLHYTADVLDSLTFDDEDAHHLVFLDRNEKDTIEHHKFYENGARISSNADGNRYFIGTTEITADGYPSSKLSFESADFKKQIDTSEDQTTFTTYYTSGSVLAQHEKSSKTTNQWVNYYPNGDTASVTTYSGGKRHGEQRGYYPGHRLAYRAQLDSNRIVSYHRFDTNGIENPQFAVEGGNGLVHIGWKSHQVYSIQNGYLHGMFYHFSQDGLQTVEYRNGIALATRKSDRCRVDEDGDDTSFRFALIENLPQNFLIRAAFKGGESEIYRTLNKSIEVPPLALEEGHSGVALIYFIIEKDGTVSNVRSCGKRLGFGMDEAAENAVKKLNGMWTPAYQDGFPARMSFRLPIRFVLN